MLRSPLHGAGLIQEETDRGLIASPNPFFWNVPGATGPLWGASATMTWEKSTEAKLHTFANGAPAE